MARVSSCVSLLHCKHLPEYRAERVDKGGVT